MRSELPGCCAAGRHARHDLGRRRRDSTRSRQRLHLLAERVVVAAAVAAVAATAQWAPAEARHRRPLQQGV